MGERESMRKRRLWRLFLRVRREIQPGSAGLFPWMLEHSIRYTSDEPHMPQKRTKVVKIRHFKGVFHHTEDFFYRNVRHFIGVYGFATFENFKRGFSHPFYFFGVSENLLNR